MKRITKILFFSFALVLLFSCSKREMEYGPLTEGITLHFLCDDLATKSGTHGTKQGEEDIYHENLIKTIEYFFFPKGKTDEPAILHGRVVANAVNSASITIPVTDALIREGLFSQSNGVKTCEVFAVANYPSNLPEDMTLPQLLNLPVSFEDNFGQQGKSNLDSFIMASAKDSKIGSQTVTLQSWDKTTSAVVNVHLKRVSAKITLAIHVENQVNLSSTLQLGGGTDVREEHWHPMLDKLQAYFVKGAKNSSLSGIPGSTHTAFNYMPDGRKMTKIKETRQYKTYQWDDSGGHQIPQEVIKTGEFSVMEPFYTYPIKWEGNSDKEPYFKIALPWTRDAGISSQGNPFGVIQKQYFYKLLPPGQIFTDENGNKVPNTFTLSSNCWYKIYLNIAILGSEFDEASLEVQGSYYVVDWQESENSHGGDEEDKPIDTDKEADIRGARYLSVPQNNYIMYNTDKLSIKYTTSDPCKIVNASVKYMKYYSGNNNDAGTPVETVLPAYKYSILLENGHIVFTHKLHNFGNSQGEDYDISEFDISFTIQHSDNAAYSKNIRITQYPAIMISAERSEHKGYYWGIDIGYVFVNKGGTTYGSDPQRATNRSNNNFNMYVIETTVLSDSSPYMLGDPRSSVDNLGSDWSVSAPSMAGGSRRLSYYRPASKDKNADNIIAPKFRIASSYGATEGVTSDAAFKRCASYQEDGYPAGRWRVPTKAEIEYMAQLNTDRKIPRLLGSNDGWHDSWTGYWCNSGIVEVANGGNNQKPRYKEGLGGSKYYYVRCVYDDWYWSNTPYPKVSNKNIFTWGDLQ